MTDNTSHEMEVENSLCPCGCPHGQLNNLRAREQEYDTTHNMRTEALNHQGHLHCPKEIASVWKKDCRTWLWKSGKRVEQKKYCDNTHKGVNKGENVLNSAHT